MIGSRRFTGLAIFSMVAMGASLAFAACSSSSVPNSSGLRPTIPGADGFTATSRIKRAASNTWTIGAPAPTHQFTGAATAIGGTVYLLGGENHTDVFNENDIYDTANNVWSKGKPMPTKRTALAAAAVNGIVYAIGGETFTGTPLGTVEAYDPASDHWSTKASLPVAVDSMTATVDNGFIYVVGGFNSGSGTPFNGVQRYDPTNDSWSSVAPLNVAKAFAYVGTIGTQIVAAGGSVGTGPTLDTEAYDPGTDAWTPKTPARLERYGGCAGAIDGRLYTAGGLEFPLRNVSRELDAYNLARNRWRKLAHMPAAALGPASAVANGMLYCIGGSPRLGVPVFSAKVQIYQP